MKRALLLCLAFALIGGCVTRKFTVQSDPPGADVYIDGELVGKTPYETEFDHYGTRLILLEMPGYADMKTLEKVSAPVYEYFPLDVVSELLVPFDLHDEHEFHYKLEPKVPAEKASVLERARAAREILRRESQEDE